MDHISNPRNKNKDHDGYLFHTLKNPSCGDIVTVYAKISNNKIEDITYDVSGCSICSSSTSIMSELLTNKTFLETSEIINNFNNMVTGEPYSEDILKEAVSLRGVFNAQPRIKCAMLCYKAIDEIVGKANE